MPGYVFCLRLEVVGKQSKAIETFSTCARAPSHSHPLACRSTCTYEVREEEKRTRPGRSKRGSENRENSRRRVRMRADLA